MKKIFALTVLAAASMQHAQAVDIKAGDWTVGVGGIVNAYYTVVSCKGDAVGGLALGSQGIGCGGLRRQEHPRRPVVNGRHAALGRRRLHRR